MVCHSRRVASRLGVGGETLRKWSRRAEIDGGVRPGVSSAEQAEIPKLRKEVTELRRANDILRTASAFFRASSTAPRRNDRICGCAL